MKKSSEQRREGNPMTTWENSMGQREEQMVRPETGVHLTLRSSKGASVLETQFEKRQREALRGGQVGCGMRIEKGEI